MPSGTNKFSVTATHATAAAATQAAPGAGKRLLINDIAGSSDKAGSILKIVEDTAGTPVTKFQIQVGVGNFSHTFKNPIQITVNKSAGVEIDGTAACKANISGEITDN